MHDHAVRSRRGTVRNVHVGHCGHLSACSLTDNRLGPESGVAIADALKVNKTVTTIECVPRAMLSSLCDTTTNAV